ncbi:MAG: ORF6N domain-containing protein [Nitrospirae bacterium]|nr:ORF6N domain-containing protein [Nitrospirota bacterium]
MKEIIPAEIIEKKIYLIREQKVMLDSDLALLYGVETFNLNKAVKRNIDRFPEDFMFQLTKEETDSLIFQSGISKRSDRVGRRHLAFAFTEQGVAMLSSVLRSKRAVDVNIEIMRSFVRLRIVLSPHKELTKKIDSMEKKYDAQFRAVFDAIRQLIAAPAKNAKKIIGFGKEE